MILNRKQPVQTNLVAVIIIAILMYSPVLVWGGTLSGNITDQSDNRGLFNAVIKIESFDHSLKLKGAVTDENGNYEIGDLAPGLYRVTISYVGFVTHEAASVAITEGDTRILNATLIPSAINVDAISVTASRQPEKILEAPASVSSIQSEEIEARTTLTPTEHLKGLPAVDVSTTGLNQSNVVVRGFNNIFSGALLVLTDNRIARVPSLRFNAHNFIPTVNEDIERIEIVSGPGSALYGPNSAAGVMHIVTKSPFGSEGTTVSFGGGDRDVVNGDRNVFIGSFRHAATSNNNRVGFKISGQYYQGDDWESKDPMEPDSITFFKPSPSGPVPVGNIRANRRDFGVEKFSGEGRVDFLIGDNTSVILNGGFNRASSIELTGLGAAQAIDWTYFYAQSRFRYKDLFVQGFVNASDAGDTYLLQTGQLIIDKSRLWVGQIQHGYTPNDRLSFTYGIDALFTRPNTESTINGRNEEKDNINEYGVYVQSDAKLSEQVKFVGAVRVDDHNHLEDMVISPRAGMVFQPDKHHNLRFTYNRAYSTPDNNNLYLDIMQAKDPFEIGAKFEPALGFRPDIDIRVQGVPETGFHWRMNDNGEGPQFRSSFAPLAGLATTDFIDFNDPMFTNVMWSAGRGAVMSGFAAALAEQGVPQQNIDVILASLGNVTPTTISNVNNSLRTFNPDTRSFDESTLDDIADIERMKPTITQTFEIGYKGILGDRLRFSVDGYRTKKDNFIGPLTVETPNIFLDPATLQSDLYAQFTGLLGQYPTDAAVLTATLDDTAKGGDGNGTPVEELTAMYTAGAAAIPFGTASPEEALDPEAVLVTYRNFGDISFYGADLAVDYHLNQYWNFGGSYSYVSKNLFKKSADQVHDIYLNAPRHKSSVHLQYTNQRLGFNAHTRVRFVDAFDMASPFEGTSVRAYTLVDLNVGLNMLYNTHLSLTIQNLLDHKHAEFVGAPAIGRLALMRISQTF